ncbi:cytochrome P450 [Gymnopilus junonius]|uniref:Cytochrome P450 n=1 Tax=Gymnopilus junonius TaxID=109634 RepID=A0A9P5NWX1_GYMJU|nr:cytochrome P450 [Gymnopilus junonius]
MTATHILVFSLALLGFFLCTRRKHKLNLPLPPGPRKLPLLGNLLDLPTSFEWETFQVWGKKYDSRIIHTSVAGQSVIILNSLQAARDLLEKRSSTYSDRPKFAVVNKLQVIMGLSWLAVFMRYGPEWRDRRRLFQRYFHPSNEKIHKPKEVYHTRLLLLQILESPNNYMDHVRHCVGGLLYSISYGSQTKALNDPFLNAAEEVAHNLSDGATTATMVVDIFPFLLRMPFLLFLLFGSTFSKSRKEWKEIGNRFRDDPFHHAQRLMREGTAEPSFISDALENVRLSEDENAQHAIIKDVAGIVIIGGSSTTSAFIHTFFLAMLCFPNAQRKAQEELDRVIGRGRLPDFGDEPELPYLDALLKEVHRWRPSGPLGVPHLSGNEDEYNGYRIPEQSIVLANIWAMFHDKDAYPEPESFKPERFLKDGRLDPSVHDPSTAAFGFGRRICPGAHIAQSMAWITAASILSVFRISPATDGKGQVIEPTIEFRSAVTCQPVPFKCRIEPRHDAAERLIRTSIE